MKSEWKVGELAKVAGLTVRTLRYYDQIGLFSPSGRSASGHRRYTEADIARLQQILALKEVGLSLEEIKSALTGGRFSPFEVVALQIDRLKTTIRLQQKLVDELEQVARLMQTREGVSAEDFTALLHAMRMTHERFFAERRTSWERNLDRLGAYLGEKPQE